MTVRILPRTLLFVMAALFSAMTFANEAEIRARVASKLIGGDNAQIQPSGAPGIWEVMLDGQMVYVTEDGRYMMQGRLVDLVEGVDMTEARMGAVRKRSLDGLGAEKMIVYEPEGEVKYTVTVFTDIDCHYCRELHKRMDGYLDAGIRVRYVFFPRAGVPSASSVKADNVWCADDRNKALDISKAMRPVPAKGCITPIEEHYGLAQELGVRATPTIITESGQLVRGYRPPAALLEELKRVEG